MAATAISITNMVAEAVRIINDSAYTTSVVLAVFNDLLLEIAGGIKITDNSGERISAPLPDLFDIKTVTALTLTNNVAMPATFQRGLVGVYNAAGYPIKIANTWPEFIKAKPLLNGVGPITRCALKGSKLYYQDCPSTVAETLTVHFHRIPNAILLTDTAVDGIPPHFVRPCLVYGSCARIFQEIEDGTEGNKTNTAYYKALFMNDGIMALDRSIPVDGEAFSLN